MSIRQRPRLDQWHFRRLRGRPADGDKGFECAVAVEVLGRWWRAGVFYGEAPGSHMIDRHWAARPTRIGDMRGWNARFGWWPKPCVTMMLHTRPSRDVWALTAWRADRDLLLRQPGCHLVGPPGPRPFPRDPPLGWPAFAGGAAPGDLSGRRAAPRQAVDRAADLVEAVAGAVLGEPAEYLLRCGGLPDRVERVQAAFGDRPVPRPPRGVIWAYRRSGPGGEHRAAPAPERVLVAVEGDHAVVTVGYLKAQPDLRG
jgi:hypothetical protein